MIRPSSDSIDTTIHIKCPFEVRTLSWRPRRLNRQVLSIAQVYDHTQALSHFIPTLVNEFCHEVVALSVLYSYSEGLGGDTYNRFAASFDLTPKCAVNATFGTVHCLVPRL
jgi:hypothetical protein